MENSRVSKHTNAFGLSLVLCSILNALLVIAKEKSKAVSAAMQRITGHHWLTHVAIIFILFAVGGWLLARTNGGQGPSLGAQRINSTILTGVVASVLIILGFYLIAG